MNQIIKIAAIAASLCAFAPSAFAKGAAPKQNHHCKLPDGSMDMAKTKKDCKTAKGTWAKDEAPAAAAPAAAPAK